MNKSSLVIKNIAVNLAMVLLLLVFVACDESDRSLKA